MIIHYELQNDLPIRNTMGKADTLPDSGWLHLSKPSKEECLLVHKKLGIPLEFLRAPLDDNERPRLEYNGGVLLIIARTPVEDYVAKNGSYKTCPIALILSDNLLVSVCKRDRLVEDILSHGLPVSDARPAVRILFSLLLRISTTFIQHLQLLDEHVGNIERTLHQSMQNRELLRMLHVEKALIYFLTALKGNQAVLKKLRCGLNRSTTSPEHDLLEDVLIENKQATDMAEIYIQIIGSLGDAFGAIVSNNLNKVMKVLTSLTIVFMIPTIIGALYGMNVTLPWQDKPYAFALLCFLCLGISFVVYRVLRNKDWM